MHRLLQRIAPLRAVPLHLVLHHSIERLPRDPPRGHLPCSETAQSGAHPAPSARGGPARREHRRLPRSDPSAGRDGTGQDREARLGPARPAARPASAGPALTEAAPRRAAAAAPPPGDVPAAPAARRAALTPALLSHACAAQAQCERSAAEGRRGTDSEGAGRGRAARERTGSGRAARGFLRPLRRGSYLPLSAPAQSARPDA